MQGRSILVWAPYQLNTVCLKIPVTIDFTDFPAVNFEAFSMAAPSARRGGTSSASAANDTVTNPAPLLVNTPTQTLLPLVTAVAQSTASSVKQSFDRHFGNILRQQQELVLAVQQLARARVQAPTAPPTTATPPAVQLNQGYKEDSTAKGRKRLGRVS